MSAFNVDFMRNGGTYMILRGANGLHSRDINRVQHTMLASLEIPGLLPLDLREINFEVSLYYEITGRRMLSQCLKSDKLSAQEFYGLLLQIVAILDDCQRYMLSPSNFIIDEEFIFVEEPLASAMLHLTYVPTREPAGQERLGLSLLTLITRILSSVTVVEGSGIQKIVSLCGDELFSTAALKKMLLDLMGGDRSESIAAERIKGSGTWRESSGSSVTIKEYVQVPDQSAPDKSKERQKLRRRKELLRVGGLDGGVDNKSLPAFGSKLYDEKWNMTDDAADDGSRPVQKGSKFTYLLLGALLVDAVCWKFIYLDAPSSWGLYVCIGITLALLIGLLLIRSSKLEAVTGSVSEAIYRLGRPSSEEEGLDDDEPANWKEPWNGGGWGEADSLYSADLKPDITRSNAMNSSEAMKLYTSKQDELWQDAIDITSLSNSEFSHQPWIEAPDRDGVPDSLFGLSEAEEPLHHPATVLLSHAAAPSIMPSLAATYRLERYGPEDEMAHVPEIIALKSGSFVIGRSEDIAQYVERTVGVSRAHVELMVREEGCSIKDLGSRNGTFLKGELIAPYKEYPLESGDIFLIAGSTYKLCS